MIYTYRKMILIIFSVILVLVVCGIGVYQYRASRQITPNVTVQKKVSDTIVKNIDTVPLSSDVKETIVRHATGIVTAAYGKNTYNIIVRDKSYQQTVSNGSTTSTILLDVPDKKVTYLYTEINSGANPLQNTSYIRCAPDDQQLVQPSVCQDIADD